MAKDLATNSISSELRDSQGYYFKEKDIDSSSVLLSDALLDGKRQGRIEIVGEAVSEILITKDVALKVELQSAVYGGDYTTFDTAYNETGASAIVGVEEVSTCETIADVGGALDGTYFTIYSPTTGYYVWNNVDAGGNDPAPEGLTGIAVAFLADATDATIATAVKTAIDAVDAFGATVSANTVTITNADTGAVEDIDAGDTGFTVAVTTTGVTAFAGGTIIPAGTEMFRVDIPSDANESIKVKVTTADTHTGTLNVFDVYRS